MIARRTRGGQRPVISARRQASSSRRPRLPGGLESWSSRARVAWPAPTDRGRTRSRSFWRSVRALAPRPRRGGALDRNGDAGDHQRDEVGGGGDTLVHGAEKIAKATTDLGGRMHALADLVGDHDDGRAALADHGGDLLGARQNG